MMLSIRPNIPEIPGGESEWNSPFQESHSEILGVSREVGLKFRKIGKPENSVPFDHSCSAHFHRARKLNSTWLPQAFHVFI